MNAPNHKKRRYFLTKARKKRKPTKMDADEVSTDYKIKQFLADVEKFSEKVKERKEEKFQKQVGKEKSAMFNLQEKRGLFENGILSKPSVKGILGLKNKARLKGNLENLVIEETTAHGSPSSSSSSEERSTIVSLCKEEIAGAQKDENDKDLHKWWSTFQEKKSQYMEEIKKIKNDKSCDKNMRLQREADVDRRYFEDAQKLTDEDCKRLIPPLGPALEVREKILKECEKRLLERILKEDPLVLETIMQVYKGSMEERGVQTDLNLSDYTHLRPDNGSKECQALSANNIFTPQINDSHFNLPIPSTGLPQRVFTDMGSDKLVDRNILFGRQQSVFNVNVAEKSGHDSFFAKPQEVFSAKVVEKSDHHFSFAKHQEVFTPNAENPEHSSFFNKPREVLIDNIMEKPSQVFLFGKQRESVISGNHTHHISFDNPKAVFLENAEEKPNCTTLFDYNNEDAINFNYSKSSNALHFLTPPKKRNSSFFEKEITPSTGCGNRFESAGWPPSYTKADKPYFPPIISPPSPGRKYSDSPTFLQLPQFERDPMNVIAIKEHNNKRIYSLSQEDILFGSHSSSFLKNPIFPKRNKVSFSPHRLF